METFKICIPWSLENLKGVRNMLNGFIDDLMKNLPPVGVVLYPSTIEQTGPAAPPEQTTAPAPPEQTTAPAPPEQTTAPAPPEQTTAPAPPEQTTAPAPPDTVGLELRKGIPWDERIHAGTKTVNADGSWRNKKGVDKTLLAQVEAELKANHATQTLTIGPSPTGQTGPAAPPEQTGPAAPPEQTGPAAPPDQTGPAPVKDYMYIVQRIAQVDPKKLAEVLAKHQLKALPELYTRPELAPIICDELGI